MLFSASAAACDKGDVSFKQRSINHPHFHKLLEKNIYIFNSLLRQPIAAFSHIGSRSLTLFSFTILRVNSMVFVTSTYPRFHCFVLFLPRLITLADRRVVLPTPPPHPPPAQPTSACVDASGRQIVIGFNTGRVACARFLTGRLVGQLDSHRGEVTDLVGAWTDDSGWVSLDLGLGFHDETYSMYFREKFCEWSTLKLHLPTPRTGGRFPLS